MQKMIQLILNSFLLCLGVFCLNYLGKFPTNIKYSINIGVFFVLFFYPFIYYLLSVKSKIVQFIYNSSNDSILNTISSGFFIGFFITFLISIGIAIILGRGVLISGDDVRFIVDYYHIGCIALSLFVSSFPIISNTLCKPIIDNVLGIAQMLSFDNLQQRHLRDLNAYSNISVSFFNIITTIMVMFTGCLYLIFYILNSLKEAKIISYYSKLQSFETTDFEIMIHNLKLSNFILPFQVHFLNGKFILGLIAGVAFIFGFIAFIMWGVSISYKKIIYLTEKEFDNSPEIFSGNKCPNYFNLIAQIAQFSNKFMVVSFVILILSMLISWVKLGIAGTIGFLISQIVFGSVLSIFFNFTGTLWANAKLLVESNDENIGKANHIAVLFSDKLGDFFKDALAPVIMDKIKFVMLVVILVASIILKFDKVLH